LGLNEEGARQNLVDDALEALPISVEDWLDIVGDTLDPYPILAVLGARSSQARPAPAVPKEILLDVEPAQPLCTW